MAKRVITTTELTDDIDGSTAERTMRFAFDDVNYEIELSKKNAAALIKAVKPYVDAARRVKAVKNGGAYATTTAKRRKDLSQVREWANSNGFSVSERGRIPYEVEQAYDAVH